MRKGFIGPIGDDLPSILGIVLALGLFFAGMSYTLNVYNQKLDNLKTMKGAIEINRIITKHGIITDIDDPTITDFADSVAESYALEYSTELNPDLQTVDCPGYAFTYLVTEMQGGEPKLATLYICVCDSVVHQC